jgi:Holliday junction resolvase RusA-like endonuclease
VKKGRALAQMIRPTVKADIDNIAKAILDGMTGVAWDDDKQVVSLRVEKTYSASPRVVVEVWEVKDDAS